MNLLVRPQVAQCLASRKGMLQGAGRPIGKDRLDTLTSLPSGDSKSPLKGADIEAMANSPSSSGSSVEVACVRGLRAGSPRRKLYSDRVDHSVGQCRYRVNLWEVTAHCPSCLSTTSPDSQRASAVTVYRSISRGSGRRAVTILRPRRAARAVCLS